MANRPINTSFLRSESVSFVTPGLRYLAKCSATFSQEQRRLVVSLNECPMHTLIMSNDDKKAEARTKWSEDRILLASERTYSSWMSTGMGAVGVAIGFKAVFGAFDPTWVAKLVATIFLGAAILIFWAARDQACRTHQRLSENDTATQSPRQFTIVATILITGTIGVGAVLWNL